VGAHHRDHGGDEDQVEGDLDHDDHPGDLGDGVDVAEADGGQGAEREVEGVGLGLEVGELARVRLLQREVAEGEQRHDHEDEEEQGVGPDVGVVWHAVDQPPGLADDEPGDHHQAAEQPEHAEGDGARRRRDLAHGRRVVGDQNGDQRQ
jgi:hypothetical protein